MEELLLPQAELKDWEINYENEEKKNKELSKNTQDTTLSEENNK